MKKIITTVGTSILTNYQKDKVKNFYGSSEYTSIDTALKSLDSVKIWGTNEIKPLVASDIYNDDYKHYVSHVKETIDGYWLEFEEKPNIEASAEIKSITEIANQYSDEDIEIHLIATDTLLSVLSAELIVAWFEEFGRKVLSNYAGIRFQRTQPIFINQSDSDYVIKDLRITNNDHYQKGFMNLIEVIEKIKLDDTVLNITGGYKAIVPILTIYGQIREMPLKYIFDEQELEGNAQVVEIGSLPISFDWVVVEALNPFLRIEFLSKPHIKTLGQLWSEGKIYFKNDKFHSDEHDSKLQMRSIQKIYHQIFNSLIYYNLIKWNKKKKWVEVNFLGELLKSLNIGFEKGYIMELVFHKYFLATRKDEVTKGYSLLDPKKLDEINKRLKEKGYFKIKNLEKKEIEVIAQKDKEIGDLDVPLMKGNKIVWGEAKAYTAALEYNKLIDKKKDYYLQLKSRALTSASLNQPFENLFIVFRFIFNGVNDDQLSTPELEHILRHLNELNNDSEINEYASFKAIGVNIPLKFKGNKVDFTDFYKGNSKDWKWINLI